MSGDYDMIGGIIAYETGELSEAGMIRLFAYLIETKQAWELQGHYGRTAHDLIVNEIIDTDGNILVDLE